jgi:acyl carrier protein
MDIKNDIIGFIASKSKIPREEIDMDTKIYNSGIISSLAMLDLIIYIETGYNIVINPEELIEDNFRDFRTLIDFINGKMNCGAGAKA